MRFQLGIVGCLLAGCAMQPTTSNPVDTALAASVAPLPPSPFVLRIGVENLSPEGDEPPAAARVEHAEGSTRRETRLSSLRAPDPIPEERVLRFAPTDNAVADEALHFVSDLLEADRHRVRREVALPFFDFQPIDPERGPLLDSEWDLQRDHEQWLQEHGGAMFRRPIHQLLRRLPLVHELEVEFDSFRSENVPLSEPWQAADRRHRKSRISLRVHLSDPEDPLEATWIWSGLRVGTSREIGKLGFDLPLTDSMGLELRARTEYASGQSGFRIDWSWRASPSTSLHVAVGDDMDFLSTSSTYSLFESPMDGSPGLVLYAVHVF